MHQARSGDSPTVIRFVTTGSDGVVLGLGVTEGNLQLLQRDDPIVFDLAELDLPPRRFVMSSPSRRSSAPMRPCPTVRRSADAWSTRLTPSVFAALPGEAPCPLQVWVPEPLGARPIASRPATARVDETARLERAFAWMFDARLMDVAPATADGLPGLSRAIRSAPDGDGWRGARTYATLVVSELEDTVLHGAVGEQETRKEALVQGTRTITTQALAIAPGRVRARLIVWDYSVDAVVCVSEPVEVETPPLHLSTFEPPSGPRSEDGVLKARTEMLVAAARRAHGQLREVRPAL